MEGVRQQYIDMVERFNQACWFSLQIPMLLDFCRWYDTHQDTLTEEEKVYLKENIRLKRRSERVLSRVA